MLSGRLILDLLRSDCFVIQWASVREVITVKFVLILHHNLLVTYHFSMQNINCYLYLSRSLFCIMPNHFLCSLVFISQIQEFPSVCSPLILIEFSKVEKFYIMWTVHIIWTVLSLVCFTAYGIVFTHFKGHSPHLQCYWQLSFIYLEIRCSSFYPSVRETMNVTCMSYLVQITIPLLFLGIFS